MNIVTNGFKNMALFWLDNLYLVLSLRKSSVESRNDKFQTNQKGSAVPRIQYKIALKCKGDLPLKTDYKVLLTVISKSVERSTEYLCRLIGEANQDGQYLKIVYDIDFCDNVMLRVNNSWVFLKKVPGLWEILALEWSKDSIDFSLLRDCLKKWLSQKVMFSVYIRIPVKRTLVHPDCVKHPAQNLILKNFKSPLLSKNVRKYDVSDKEEIGNSSDRTCLAIKPAEILNESLIARICFRMYLKDVLEVNEGRSISLSYLHKSRNRSYLTDEKTKSILGVKIRSAPLDQVPSPLKYALKRSKDSFKSKSYVKMICRTDDDLFISPTTEESKLSSYYFRGTSQAETYCALLDVESFYDNCLNDKVLESYLQATSALKDSSFSVFSIPSGIEESVEQVMRILSDVCEKTEYTESAIQGERPSLQGKDPNNETVEENAIRDCPYSIDYLKTWNYKQTEVIVSRLATENEKPLMQSPGARSKLFGAWTNLTSCDSKPSNEFVYNYNSLRLDDDEGWSAVLAKMIVDFLDEDIAA